MQQGTVTTLLGTKHRKRKFKPGFNLYMRIKTMHTNIVISSEHFFIILTFTILSFVSPRTDAAVFPFAIHTSSSI